MSARQLFRPLFGDVDRSDIETALDDLGVKRGQGFFVGVLDPLSPVGQEPKARARRSDPATSHEAAKLPRSGQKREIIDALLAAEPHGLTASEVAEKTGMPYVSTSTKLTPLRREGWVRNDGVRQTTLGGRANVVRLTDAGLEKLGALVSVT